MVVGRTSYIIISHLIALLQVQIYTEIINLVWWKRDGRRLDEIVHIIDTDETKQFTMTSSL